MRILDRSSPAALAVPAVAAAVALAGCGGGDSGSPSAGTAPGAPVHGKRGGKLTVLWTDDVDHIDCGETYYQLGEFVCSATERSLYWYKPDDPQNTVPDMASSAPVVSDGGHTVTVHLKSGVRFSPPVNREVTSKDVKYAIERGFFNTVNNGYAAAYFGDLIGAKQSAEPGTEIPGIETPDRHTVVFKLKRPTGGVLAGGALSLPLSAPVPPEYAKRFDAQNPSTYGEHQVATGPYMIANDAAGKAVGYQAGKDIHLVRNPNWDRDTDFRPAYLDEIDMPQGNDDTTVASRRILQGRSMVNGDFSPEPAVTRDALLHHKGQIQLVPNGGIRWISLNTTIPPFDDVNVRKAVIAGFDRNAMRLARGGQVVGDMPTHLIAPGVPGFAEAGGLKGPGIDFLNASGQPNQALSAAYFRKAGYPSGKYAGGGTLFMVGTSGGVAGKDAEIAQQNFERMGFKVRLRLVTQDAMYTKFCNVPSAKVAVCPSVGWLKDFSDPQTFLDPTFNGKNILPQGNSNWSQLDDPAINRAMDDAEVISDQDKRAATWARIDRMVMEQAPVIPWLWDKLPYIESSNVNGVMNRFLPLWDLSFTSLK